MKKITILLTLMLISTISFSQLLGPNLVTNGDFEDATPNGWYSGAGAGLNIVTEGGNRLNRRDNLPTGGNVFAVNISQIINLENGKEYEFKFDARTTVTSRTLVAGLGQSAAPFAALVNPPFTLTNTFQTFTRNITINYGNAVTDRVIFDMAGGGAGSVLIDNVSVKEILPEPPITGDVYVNDNSLVGDVFTTAVGQDLGTATGSTSLPYKSITDLFADRVIGPGATIHVDSGTYSGRITFSDSEDGTAGNVIAIKGAGTNLTSLTSSLIGGSLISTNGADFMTFQDMTITGGNEENAILVAGTSTNCTFNNLNITGNNKGIRVDGGSNLTTISNNKINGDNEGATDYGIFFTNGAGNGHSIFNNMVSNFAHTFRSDNTGTINCNLYNNSFFANQFGAVAYLTGWNVKNNIFSTTSTNAGNTALWYGINWSPATLDHNLYYHPNAARAITRFSFTAGETVVYASLVDFVAATPYEDNGVEGNPLFTSTTDLHILVGSPAIGAGTNVGITLDIDGDPRPQSGAFDVGADEFTGAVSSIATLSNLEIDGISITGFSPVISDYTVVASSVSSIPQITLATATSPTAESVVITQATDVFEDATVVVTAEDGVTTETYTVRIGLVTPDIIQDFEPPATYTGLTGDNGTAASVVSSPGGVTGNSLELVSTSGGQTFQAGFFDQVSDFVVLTPENNTVQVDVYASQSFNLRLKLEIGGTPIERTLTYDGSALNTWQTLTYDFGAINATYSRIVFFLNSNATNDGFLPSQNFTAFVDHIALSSVQTERLTYTYQSGSWSPENPVGVSTSFDNVSVLDGTASVSANLNANDLQIASGATLNVTSAGVLNIARNIENNGDLVFQSDLAGAGQLAAFSGVISGTGDETMERFIPARRAFRMLSSSVDAGSIFNNWQEGAGPPITGLGTHITGAQGITGTVDSSTGFDFTTTGDPSMFAFDNEVETQTGGNVWVPVPNTNATNLSAGTPYRILVRGDRLIDLSTNSPMPNSTTLRSKGSLFTGTVNHTFTHADNIVFVGNPYQSVVDLKEIDYTGVLSNEFAIWDPNMATRGAFVTVTTGTGVPDPTDSDANEFLQPGQAIFFRTTATGPHSITFNETDKASAQPQTEVFSTTTIPYLNIRLYETERFNNGGKAQDAVGLRLHDESSIGQYTNALKLTNSSENIGFINNTDITSIQHEVLPTAATNFPLFLNNHEHENYTFRIQLENIPSAMIAYLKDDYTNELIALVQGVNVIPFEVNTAVPESLSNFRFSIQFELETFSNEDFEEVAFAFYPNPTNDVLSVNLGSYQATNTKVNIYDLTGRSLIKTNFTTNQSIIKVDMSSLNAGLYLVEVQEGNRKVTSKVMKK